MKLTKEEALRYHRQLWSDMQRELGNCPNERERVGFKIDWCREHFPNEHIHCHCFLCHYAVQFENSQRCTDYCPIVWDRKDIKASCEGRDFEKEHCWRSMLISEILALPERKDVE